MDTLPPMPFTQFEVMPHARMYLNELNAVNRGVNLVMQPAKGNPPDDGAGGWTPWRNPAWCGDFAITKQLLLKQMGWKPEALQLAVVYTAEGAKHAVLIVTVPDDGKVVLDNRVDVLRAPEKTGYKFIETQINGDTWIGGNG